jgi:hypothetical protein
MTWSLYLKKKNKPNYTPPTSVLGGLIFVSEYVGLAGMCLSVFCKHDDKETAPFVP